MSVDLESLSTKHGVGLMTFSWNYFGLAKTTSAKLTALNDNSFGVKVFLKRKETKDVVYNFTSEEKKKATDLSERLAYVLRQHMGPSFPPFGLVSLLAWFVAIIATVSVDKLFPPFNILKSYVMKLVSEKVGWYLLYFIVGTHVLESVYTLVAISPVVKSPSHILSWVGMDLIFGYPITERVMILSKLHTKSKK